MPLARPATASLASSRSASRAAWCRRVPTVSATHPSVWPASSAHVAALTALTLLGTYYWVRQQARVLKVAMYGERAESSGSADVDDDESEAEASSSDASEEETRYRFPSGRTPSGCGRMRSRARSSSVVSERSRWSRELFHCARAVGRHFRWRAWPGRPPFWDGTAPRALVANARTLARARVPSIGGALAVRLARPSLEVAVAARRDARASATPPRPRTSA